MDSRDLGRLNIKFGKFLDPVVIVLTIATIFVSIASVNNLSPRTFSKDEEKSVLGITTDNESKMLELVGGEHNYITSENLKEITPENFQYSTLVKKRSLGKYSKPILNTKGTKEIKVQLAYTNSNNSKISLVDEANGISYILQDKGVSYSPMITLNSNSKSIYLLVENSQNVHFNQYIEINFFVNP